MANKKQNGKCLRLDKSSCYTYVFQFYLIIFILCQMSSTNINTNKIGKNYFILRGRDGLYFKGQTIVNFSHLRKTKQIKHNSIIPTYNSDRHYFTISFQLPSSTPENIEEMRTEHSKKVEESLLEIQNIMMPKPRSKHKYCGVCRSHYQDYKDHIESEDHCQFLSRSIFQGQIGVLCNQFQKKMLKREEEIKIVEFSSEEEMGKMSCESVETCTPSKPIQN